ncbi:MAG: Cytochrome c, class [Bryobacterales bacterium]|nr:Cytochrome c, class [Bryobacterales bacterium]
MGLLLVGMAENKNSFTLPPPFATPSADNHPDVVPRPAGASLKVPAGFHVEEWASGFQMPRYLLRAPNGDILLAESGEHARAAAVGGANPADSGGKIYIYPNGRAAVRKTLISGLDRPYGMAFYKNYLYVAETESVKRFPYDAEGRTAGKGEEVVSLKGLSEGHWTRAIQFDRQGQKMYVAVGSGSNVDAGEDPRRAAINRYNVDGSGHEIYAAGMRNPVDIHWYPGTDTLWAAVQERDALGDDLVPDYFTHVTPGGFYGWPYAYIGPHEDPRRKGERQALVAKTIVPDVLLGSHVAVLAFDFYEGKQFPAKYKGGAFLTFHGSWNRSSRVGQSVAFIPFQNGKPSGPREDFLTGWMIAPESKQVWGRPVGICEMADGSLLVSDDGGKKVWHISYGK